MLKNHADPNKEGLGGETPLLFAASQGQSDIIDQLLNHGADINHTDMVIRYITRSLLNVYWKTNQRSQRLLQIFQNGGTALMYAVFGGFPEIVKKLLGLFVNFIVKYCVSMLDLVSFAFNCRRQPDA